MRYLKVFPLIVALALLASITACHSSDDHSNGPNGSNTTPGAGTWKVSYFFDKQDKTANYSNYQFEFGANGSISATGNGQTVNGTWLTGFDDSANKFMIDFSGTVPSSLSEMEEDWRIIEIRDDFMHLEHTSGGNGNTDVLKFTKS